MSPQALHDIRRKLRILNHAKTCRHFGISREIFYRWKRAYEKEGEEGSEVVACNRYVRCIHQY